MEKSKKEPLWIPSKEFIESTEIWRFITYINKEYGQNIKGGKDLYRWSVEKIPDFWEAVWKFSGIIDLEWFMKCLPEREFARQTYELFAYHKDKKGFRWRLRNLLRGYYENGGRLNYPEIIPLMILHHLLWRAYTPKRFKENKKLFEINLNNAENIVKEYRSVISEFK